jgi:hypothetical protein
VNKLDIPSLLQELRRSCGSPGYRKLAAYSEEIIRRPDKDHHELRPLSTTAISNVLGGKRKGPPQWGWVATFVLACRMHALATRRRVPDEETLLREWAAVYHAMRSGPGLSPRDRRGGGPHAA